jgi:beta-lactamase regulating signal transducer with metallopeptidase domain/outer membrane protein assembly factor BamB
MAGVSFRPLPVFVQSEVATNQSGRPTAMLSERNERYSLEGVSASVDAPQHSTAAREKQTFRPIAETDQQRGVAFSWTLNWIAGLSAKTLSQSATLVSALWLCGASCYCLWHVGGWITLTRLRRIGVGEVKVAIRKRFERLRERAEVSEAVQLWESVLVEVPMVIGCLRPVILIPVSMVSGLSVTQIDAILEHELAHIRRHDYFVNLIQSVAEALFFHHPAVWWISRQIRIEREHCCDDAAARLCGSELAVVQALVAVEENRVNGLATAMSGTNNKGDTMNRIKRLLGESTDTPSGARALCGCLVLLALSVGLLTSLANSADKPPPPPRTLNPGQKNPGQLPAGESESSEFAPLLLYGIAPPSSREVNSDEVDPVRKDPALYYSFDDDSDGKVHDESGHELHGRTVGDVNYQSSFRGRAAKFTSNKTYILCDDLCMDRWRQLTASCWIKTNRITNHAQVLACGEVVGEEMSGFVMQVGGTSKAVWNVTTEFQGRSRQGQKVVTSSLLSSRMNRVGKWVHVVGVFDGTFVKFYIDGKLDAKNEVANLAPIVWNPRSHKLVIGNTANKSRMAWSDKYFDGLIDEVKIWKRALTAKEISAIHADGSAAIASQKVLSLAPRPNRSELQNTQHSANAPKTNAPVTIAPNTIAPNTIAPNTNAANTSKPILQLPGTWGKEKDGLRMRLSVTNHNHEFSNLHGFRVEIQNRRKTPVHLVGQLEPSGPQVKSYEEYLRHVVWFTTNPALEASSAGSDFAAAPRKPVQTTIDAGATFTAQWTQSDDLLGTYNGPQCRNLFRDGRYDIRAHVNLTTLDRKTTSLSSDEQHYIVGDRHASPHRSIAQVVGPSPTANSVQLNVGSNDDVRKGDIFRIVRKGTGRWELRITDVDRDQSTAIVSVHLERRDVELPPLPPTGTTIWLHTARMDTVDPQKVAWSVQHDDLIIGLKLNKNHFVSDEAMVFDLYAKNVGRKVLKIPSIQQALESSLWSIVIQASGKPGKYICRRLVGDLLALPTDQLKPNDVVSTRIDSRMTTLQHEKKFIEKLPVGKYVVSVEYQTKYGKPKLKCGWYEIEIVAQKRPQPKDPGSSNARSNEHFIPALLPSNLVTVNSQKTLADAVGDGFLDKSWMYPKGLVPTEFPELKYVSGPTEKSLSPKGAWRKPIVLKHEDSGVVLHVNCYKRRDKPAPKAIKGVGSPSVIKPYRSEKNTMSGRRQPTERIKRARCQIVCMLLLQIGIAFVAGGTPCAAADEDWPYFRGPNRNGISGAKLDLIDTPKVLWKISDLGTGYRGSPAIVDGKLYINGGRPADRSEPFLHCLDASTGKELWKIRAGRTHSTPAVHNGSVYCSGDRLHVRCFDAANGELKWTSQELPISKTEGRGYGHAGSPLVWEDLLIVNYGYGVALNLKTGEVVWKFDGYGGLATPVIFSYKRKPAVAIFCGDKLVARDARTGKEIWEIPWKTNYGVNACDPTFFDNDTKMFVASSYGMGRVLFDISGDTPTEIWSQGSGSSFASGIYLDGQLYSMERGFGGLDMANGKRVIRGPAAHSVLAIDGKFILLEQGGNLHVGQIENGKFEELVAAQILEAETWNVPAFYNGKLYVRSKEGVLICVQIGKS